MFADRTEEGARGEVEGGDFGVPAGDRRDSPRFHWSLREKVREVWERKGGGRAERRKLKEKQTIWLTIFGYDSRSIPFWETASHPTCGALCCLT